MLKFFIASLLAFLALFQAPPLASAITYTETYQGIKFTVKVTPEEIFGGTDTDINLTITTDKPFFNPATLSDYRYSVHDGHDYSCIFTDRDTAPRRQIKSETEFSVSKKFALSGGSCWLDPKNWDTWVGQFWVGLPQSNENTFIKNLRFPVLPAGGASVRMYAVNSPLYFKDKPQVHITNLKDKQWYTLWWDNDWGPASSDGGVNDTIWQQQGDGEVTKALNNPVTAPAKKVLKIAYDALPTHIVGPGVSSVAQVEFNFIPTKPEPAGLSCKPLPNARPGKYENLSIEARGLEKNTSFIATMVNQDGKTYPLVTVNSGNDLVSYFPLGQPGPGKYTVTITNNANPANSQPVCAPVEFGVSEQVNPPSARPASCKPGDPSCTSSGGIPCDPKTGGAGSRGIYTAIGCVPTDPVILIQNLFTIAIGAGGVIALLLMIGGAFTMISSAGNPEGVKKGSEMFTNAIIGLLIIVMSTLLLKIIGVDILMIPGFIKLP